MSKPANPVTLPGLALSLAEAHGPHSTRPEGQPAAMIRRRSFKEITPSGVIFQRFVWSGGV